MVLTEEDLRDKQAEKYFTEEERDVLDFIVAIKSYLTEFFVRTEQQERLLSWAIEIENRIRKEMGI